MNDIIKTIASERDLKKWRTAVYALGQPANREKRFLLLELLFRKKQKVLLRAIQAVGMLGLRIAASRLAYLLRFGGPYVRLAAAIAMKTCATEREMDELEEALSDVIVEVGIESSMAIAHLGGYAGLMVLVKAADSEDQIVALHGLYGIEEIKDPECKPHLLRLLEADRPGELRTAAASALAGMEPHSWIRQSIKCAMLEEEDDKFQLEFATALMRMGEDLSWLVLPKLKSPDANTREAAAMAIGKCFSEDAVAFLRELVKDPVADVRRAAWDSLATFYRAGKITELGKREKFPVYAEMVKHLEFEDNHYSIVQVMDEKDV
ncbi:MAG: hypothetical protein A2089_03875 [Elusimicrobia bacterium GWD2_63_28]|nr:MAG: hypothetical protein A2089_03875 [Elusimicrobia bacterium GWD2_63_28]